MQKMLRELTGDDGIVVNDAFKNEGYIQSEFSKKVIFDIPVRLLDGRISDLEVQAAPQEFIFRRAEIYSSELLMMQYSVEEGQQKSELDYRNVCGTVVIVLMKESPELFQNCSSERYIHRFQEQRADSALHTHRLCIQSMCSWINVWINFMRESTERKIESYNYFWL